MANVSPESLLGRSFAYVFWRLADQLKWGPDTYEQTGGVVYWQMNHTTPDSLQRRDRRRRWQEAVEEARPVTPQEIFKTTGKKLECPREGMVACPGSRLGSYQVRSGTVEAQKYGADGELPRAVHGRPQRH